MSVLNVDQSMKKKTKLRNVARRNREKYVNHHMGIWL